MAAYKTLKGQSIRKVAQDPTNPLLGEIWYNTTLGLLKGYKQLLQHFHLEEIEMMVKMRVVGLEH